MIAKIYVFRRNNKQKNNCFISCHILGAHKFVNNIYDKILLRI